MQFTLKNKAVRNKGLRNEIEKRKWQQRLRTLGIPESKRFDFTCYKAQGKPCSCLLCSPEKYSRKRKHKGQEE